MILSRVKAGKLKLGGGKKKKNLGKYADASDQAERSHGNVEQCCQTTWRPEQVVAVGNLKL